MTPRLIKNAQLLDSRGMRPGWIATDGARILATGDGDAACCVCALKTRVKPMTFSQC